MKENLMTSAEALGMLCRRHINNKKDLPIRSSEMGVLIFTHKQIEPVTPLMISEFFKITKPSVTSSITALVKGGFLTKESSATDRRSYTLKVTEKGSHLVESTYDDYYKSIELLKEKMGEDKFQQFIELVQLANRIWNEVE